MSSQKEEMNGVLEEICETQKPIRTVDLTPSWTTAVRIYIACLENPDASPESKEGARKDLLKLAEMVDNRQRGTEK